MSMHPLKLVSLVSISGLILSQLGLLFWLSEDFRFLLASVLTIPLLIPLRGLMNSRRYTYKWVGFLTMLYMVIGISESFSNPDLRMYGAFTIFFSTALFIGSVYYTRYLRQSASG